MEPNKVQRLALLTVVALLLGGILACDFGGGAATPKPLVTPESPGTAKPRVTLESPTSGIELEVGQQVEIVGMVEDPKGVVSVDLAVDGVLYTTEYSPSAGEQPQWEFVETWVAEVDPGIHTLTITAWNVDKVASDPVSISATVVEGPAPEAPTATTATALPTNTPVVPQQAMPDLVVTDFSVDPASVAYGGSAEATFTIRNAGSAPAGDCHVMYIWAPSGPVRGCDRYTGPLPAGAEITLGCSAGPLYESYETHILVDTGGVVAESNEDNNWAGFMVNVAAGALPDLTIQELSLNPWPFWGNEGDATITVANIGSGNAGSFTLYYWWAESERCEWRMDPLPAGAQVTASCHVGPFSGPFNTYATADVISEVAESSDDNNRRDLYVAAD
jgi:hypothetical protein